jgi:hypothetical protein
MIGNMALSRPHSADSDDLIPVQGAPGDSVAARSTLTGEHFSAFVGSQASRPKALPE